jgi:hypothetical protein
MGAVVLFDRYRNHHFHRRRLTVMDLSRFLNELGRYLDFYNPGDRLAGYITV